MHISHFYLNNLYAYANTKKVVANMSNNNQISDMWSPRLRRRWLALSPLFLRKPFLILGRPDPPGGIRFMGGGEGYFLFFIFSQLHLFGLVWTRRPAPAPRSRSYLKGLLTLSLCPSGSISLVITTWWVLREAALATASDISLDLSCTS